MTATGGSSHGSVQANVRKLASLTSLDLTAMDHITDKTLGKVRVAPRPR